MKQKLTQRSGRCNKTVAADGGDITVVITGTSVELDDDFDPPHLHLAPP